MLTINWPWLGGFFDGDGSASIYIVRYRRYGNLQLHFRPRLFFTQNERKILEMIRDFLNTGCMRVSRNFDKRYNRVFYSLEIQGYKSVREVAQKLLPYTIIKRRQLELILKFCNLRPSWHYPWRKEEFLEALNLIEEITLLNKKVYLRRKKTLEMIKILKEEVSKLPPRSKVYNVYRMALT